MWCAVGRKSVKLDGGDEEEKEKVHAKCKEIRDERRRSFPPAWGIALINQIGL